MQSVEQGDSSIQIEKYMGSIQIEKNMGGYSTKSTLTCDP